MRERETASNQRIKHNRKITMKKKTNRKTHQTIITLYFMCKERKKCFPMKIAMENMSINKKRKIEIKIKWNQDFDITAGAVVAAKRIFLYDDFVHAWISTSGGVAVDIFSFYIVPSHHWTKYIHFFGLFLI